MPYAKDPTGKMYHKTRRKNLIAEGLCVFCGKSTAVPPNKHCSGCGEKRKQILLRAKREAMDAYGRFCQCCGEDRLEFLSLDHIKGGGSKFRKENGGPIYSYLRKRKYPQGYRVLCMNCNFALGILGYCPHDGATSFVVLRSGTVVSRFVGAPTLDDVAHALGKICRYAGNTSEYWSVLQHSFVVADLLPDRLKLYGLLHDAIETVTNDLPGPFKPPEFRKAEKQIEARFLTTLGLPHPSEMDAREIKTADTDALHGEVWVVATPSLRGIYQQRSAIAERLVMKYLAEYPPMECLTPDGRAVIEFLRRYRVYYDMFNLGAAYQEPAV